jgi:hypothetical protein
MVVPVGGALDLLVAISILVVLLAATVIYVQSWRAVGRAFEYAATHPPDASNGEPEPHASAVDPSSPAGRSDNRLASLKDAEHRGSRSR